MHSQCILQGLVYIRCGTTLPPTNKIYIYLPTEKFIWNNEYVELYITHHIFIIMKKKMLKINKDEFRSTDPVQYTTFLRYRMMWNPCSLRMSKAISLIELWRARKHNFI
jgi:hypothetical protein